MTEPVSSIAPRRFVFALTEAGGNVGPTLAVVRKLVARGHAVAVLSDPCNREDIVAAGAAPFAWSQGRKDKSAESDKIRDWEVKSPLALAARVRDRMMLGPALGHAIELRQLIEQCRPDAVVVSDLMFGTMIAAEGSGAASVALCANIPLWPVPGLPPIGPGFAPAQNVAGQIRDAAVRHMMRRILGKRTRQFNIARSSMGLPAIAHPLDQPGRLDAVLVLTSKAFEFPTLRASPRLVYCGPELDDPADRQPWTSPWPVDDARPLIVVAFSTTFQNQKPVLDRIIIAAGQLEARVIVTTGSILSGCEWDAPANVHICESAPHGVLFPSAALVITHAGHGTAIRALAAGAPLLAMPMGRDQNDNAARVKFHGAGLTLSHKASPESIRRTALQLLQSREFRERAQQLGRQIRQDANNSIATGMLEQLAATKDLTPQEKNNGKIDRHQLPVP